MQAQDNCFEPEIINPKSFSPYDSSLTTPSVHLNSTFFLDSLKGFIGGFDWKKEKSVILTTNDGGTTWVSNTLEFDINILSIYFNDKDNGFAVGNLRSGNQGTILKTIDGGVTWSNVHQIIAGLFSVNFISPSTGFVGGANGVLLKTVDSGISWQATSSGSTGYLFNISIREDSTIYVSPGGHNSIIKSVDKGVSWQIDSISYPQTISVQKVAYINNSVGFAVAAFYRNSIILKTVNGGTTWEQVFRENDLVLLDISFIDDLHGIVVGRHGTIITTNDGGNTWSRCYTIQDPYTVSGLGLTSSTKAGDHSLIAVGEAGVIFKFDIEFAQVQTTTSIQNSSLSSINFKVYPNPAQGSLNILLNKDDQYLVKIFSSQGQEIRVFVIKEKETNIKLTNVPSGIYFVNLSNEKEAYSQKIVLE
jgi:photosystem II stability/assembly factor-like uncharacterized protein